MSVILIDKAMVSLKSWKIGVTVQVSKILIVTVPNGYNYVYEKQIVSCSWLKTGQYKVHRFWDKVYPSFYKKNKKFHLLSFFIPTFSAIFKRGSHSIKKNFFLNLIKPVQKFKIVRNNCNVAGALAISFHLSYNFFYSLRETKVIN